MAFPKNILLVTIGAVALAAGISASNSVPKRVPSRLADPPSEPRVAQAEQRTPNVPEPVAPINAIVATASSGEMPKQVEDRGAPSVEEQALWMQNDFDAEKGHRELRQVEQAVDSMLGAYPVKGARVEEMECRSTVCRLVTRFDDVSSDKDFFRTLFSPPKPIPGTESLNAMSALVPQHEVQPDGSIHAVVYMRRASH